MSDAPRLILKALTILAVGLAALAARADETPPLPALQESSFWQAEVDSGDMPPVAERLPEVPLVVDLAAKGHAIVMSSSRRRAAPSVIKAAPCAPWSPATATSA